MAKTIRDVARHAGVGVGTVSRVLNNSPHVSASTRKRVQASIVMMGYRPNPIARRLSLGKTLTIGAIVPTFTRPAFVERLRGVVNGFSGSEYDLVIYNVESAEQRKHYLLDGRIDERVDGVIIISIQPNEQESQRLLTSKQPVVLLDATHPALNSISVDDIAGAQLAVQHLIALGHTRIAYISDFITVPLAQTSLIIGNNAMHNRLIGYQKALAAAAIPFNPDYHRENVHSRSGARDSARELLQMAERPTAIFAASDTQAFGVLQAAEELGMRVPQDLSVVGYDDIESAAYLHLTTVRQSLIESGIEGAKLMLDTLTRPNAPLQQSYMPVELVIRQTTATHT